MAESTSPPGSGVYRITKAVAEDLRDFGGLLRCTVCGREQALGDIAGRLERGWPKCHDLTMRWVTQSQLDEEVTADG